MHYQCKILFIVSASQPFTCKILYMIKIIQDLQKLQKFNGYDLLTIKNFFTLFVYFNYI